MVLARINLKSYGNHNQNSLSSKLGNVNYDDRIRYIKPMYIIDNPVHGAYGEFYGADASLLQIPFIAEMQSWGTKVFGYITAGYEGDGTGGGEPISFSDLTFNQKCIKDMFEIDHVDGVFIDECSEDPSLLSRRANYLKTLVDLIHSYGGIAWGNTGVMSFNESWFLDVCGFDLMQASEAWSGQSISGTSMGRRPERITTTGFSGSYNKDIAVQYTLNAYSKGIYLCYINDREYVDFSPWFEDYIDQLKALQADGTIIIPPIPYGGGEPPVAYKFTPGSVKTAVVNPTVNPAGIQCSIEIFLGPNDTTKAASSIVNFISTGLSQNIRIPVTMPGVGTYHVYLDIYSESVLIASYKSSTDVIIETTAIQGNTSGIVNSIPQPTGGADEYEFYLLITDTTVPGISVGDQIWCSATTIDFPDLLTVGATLDGDLDNSLGWWRLIPADTAPPPPPPSSRTGLCVPLYVYPGPLWDQMISLKQSYPEVPMIAIVNANNGPGSRDTNYATGITRMRAAGIIVCGYVWVTYADSDVSTWRTFYPDIDGLFIDGYSAFGSGLSKVNLARSLGMYPIIGNPGSDAGAAAMSAVDIACVYESYGYPSIGSVQGWGSSYGRDKVYILVHTAPTLDTGWMDYAKPYCKWVYITNDVMENPWDTLASYIQQEVANLAK